MTDVSYQSVAMTNYSRRWIVTALFLVGTALMAPSASARRRVRLPITGLARGARIPAGTEVLSLDELRRCVALETKVEAQATELEAHEGRVSAKASEVETLDARLKALEPRIDVSDQASVDRFNALVDRHRKLVGEYNAMLPAINAKVTALNVLTGNFNSICANKVYYIADMTAVRAGG